MWSPMQCQVQIHECFGFIFDNFILDQSVHCSATSQMLALKRERGIVQVPDQGQRTYQSTVILQKFLQTYFSYI